jgi:phospholipid/cholesterol/gamma-HCH transport system permease protein
VQNPAAPSFGMLTNVAISIAGLGGSIIRTISNFGEFVKFALATFRGVAHPRSWMRRERLMRQLFFVGTMSVPVLVITGGFIGMILAFEGYRQFQSIGQESRLGGVINVSVVKQIGPVLAAVMLAGRVGCSLSAELGSMRVTEQLDAMRAMGSDPIRVLVVPRFLACVLMIPLLTIVSNGCGVIGGWLITTKFYNADPVLYARFSAGIVGTDDVLSGLIKSVFFGIAIGLISCWKGFTCKPGAEGVGEATTEAFVTCFITIIMISMVMAKFLNDLVFIIFGGVESVFK